MDRIPPAPMPASPLSRLQQLARPQPVQERCELCSAPIGPEHPHLLELKSRQIACACEPCAILFSGHQSQRYRRIFPRVSHVDGIDPDEGLWESLSIPIKLAFFYHHSGADKIIAMYPSPAGATESLLPMDSWEELRTRSPLLQRMQSDVEALLINQVGGRRDCLLVSIDECYRLVGLIRMNWRGLSGGLELWKVIAGFFDDLNRRATRATRTTRAGGNHA